MPEKKVEMSLDDLVLVDENSDGKFDYVKIDAQEIIEKIKQLKEAGGLEGGVGIGVVW